MNCFFNSIMLIFFKCLSFVIISILVCPANRGDHIDNITKVDELSTLHLLPPKVIISILIRNKAHALPYFLGNLERLNYPKSRIGLFIRVDHCEDNSADVITRWLDHVSVEYHSINIKIEKEPKTYDSEGKVTKWTKSRFENIMRLKEEALNHARNSWADYLFMIDVDVMIVDEHILQHLTESQLPIVSPLLKCTNLEPYSNFWGAMSSEGYYERSNDYFEIRRREKIGIFKVPMVHSVVLININMESTRNISFLPGINNTYPIDDLIIFAKSVEKSNSSMYINNLHLYGYMSSPLEDDELDREVEVFDHLKFQIMLDREDLKEMFTVNTSIYLPEQLPKKSKLGFDEVYMINLKRRTDRYKKMQYLFDQLGIDAKYFEAVDGKLLNETYINSMGIIQLQGYADPYHKRDLKMGEIGCFLSHYFIWQEMIKKNYENILIFEDDIRFGPGFIRGLDIVLEDANTLIPNWELLYIGRKRMSDKEKFVAPGSSIVYPDYTYWTLGYILKRSGAKKLLEQRPLGKMIAVDEYLPIMFDRHPEDSWKQNFEPRNLVAISSEPLLLEPTHYTGEPNYISDTEDSIIVDNNTLTK